MKFLILHERKKGYPVILINPLEIKTIHSYPYPLKDVFKNYGNPLDKEALTEDELNSPISQITMKSRNDKEEELIYVLESSSYIRGFPDDILSEEL